MSWGFPGDSVIKNISANAGDTRDRGSIPGPVLHHFARKIPWKWTEEPGRLQSMGLQRVGHD